MKHSGEHYEAKVEVALDDVSQARNFAMFGTKIGEQVKADVEETEVVDLLDSGGQLVCEVTYPDGFGPEVQAELDAARDVKAEITITPAWVGND